MYLSLYVSTGGDDMFYIIENLKYYLSSKSIQDAVLSGEGIYLGIIISIYSVCRYNYIYNYQSILISV
jgi:hypothetical protein